MTIEEINKIREEAEAKENEDRIRKEVAAERAAANRLQAQIDQEVLPIHRDLIAFLKSETHRIEAVEGIRRATPTSVSP
jgi:hypothetical protein